MQLVTELQRYFQEKANRTQVECVCVGLRYTAVTTSDGGMGIAYTYTDGGHGCAMGRDYRDFEGASAVELLACIQDSMPLRRTMGLALVNALNYQEACGLPDDSSDRSWMDSFAIGKETRVAMVGFFRPLMKHFRDRGALVEVLDDSQGVGDRGSFFKKLGEWAQVLLLTSTSILNDTTEEVLGFTAPGVKVVMIGPSTPLVAEAVRHLPVHVLAGTVPVDKEAVMRAVRHGAGTPVIHRFSRKVVQMLPRQKKV